MTALNTKFGFDWGLRSRARQLHLVAKSKLLYSRPRIFIINPKRFSWPGLHCRQFENQVGNYGISCLRVPAIEFRDTHSIIQNCDPSELPQLTYRGVNLYQAAIYCACVELETTPRRLDCTNRNHQPVLTSWMSQASHYTDYLIDQIEKHDPACFVYLQGYFYDTSVARQLAVHRNIKLCAFEITFNKEKLVWDSISGLSVNKTLAKNYYWRFTGNVPVAEVDSWYKKFIDSYKISKHRDHISNNEIYNFPRKRVITYIGQVFTDSSTLFGLGKGFVDQVEIINWLKQYAEEKGHFLFVKLHPKECSGSDPVKHAPLNQLTWRKLQPWEDSVASFVDKDNLYDTNHVIEHSDVIVTINSQAGLEGVMQAKKVILCGEAFFGGLGFTQDVQSPATLHAALDESLENESRPLNSSKIAEFVYIYFTKYCLDTSEEALATRICELVKENSWASASPANGQ